MTYVDSTRAGVLNSVTQNVFGDTFDDKFQAWLSSVLNIPSQNVKPNIKREAVSINTENDYAFFEFTSVKHNGLPNTISFDSETQTDQYDCTAVCRVFIIGNSARETALFLHDVLTMSQNVYEISSLGLGLSDARIINFSQIEQGNRRTLQAVVDLDFNYVYRRVWDLRSLRSAEVQKIFSR